MRRVTGALSAAFALILCSCATYQAYEGPSRSSSEVAIIEGSAKLRSELPLALVIRSVDGRDVDLRYSSVAVEPGKHQLIVDCQVGGSAGTASRHAVVIDVSAGTRYRLNAQMSPGNRSCASVELEAR